MDIAVTVPKNFKHPAAPGKKGLAAWLAEGDAPGTPWSGQEWFFTTYGTVPRITSGERVYVVCEDRLVGYAPLIRIAVDGKVQDRLLKAGAASYRGPIAFVRGGGAVACTIDEKIVGFRGWRYVWWKREDERPLILE